MGAGQKIYSLIARSFRFEPVRKLKRRLRPLKHALVGKRGIYQAIDTARALSRRVDKEIRVVLDVGAADGEYALTFLKSFPRATVFCFEPQSASYAILQKKVAAYENRTKLFKIGLYNQNKEMKLNLMSYADSSSLLPSPPGGQSIIGTEIITVRTLDSFTKENGIDHIDFLKVDTEGVDKEVLEGARTTLSKVDHLFIEISVRKGTSEHDDIARYLRAAGLVEVGEPEDNNYFFSRPA